MAFGQLTRQQVGLEKSVLVDAPLFIPNVFILQHFTDDGFIGVTEPELTERLHLRLQSVDHSQDPNCGSKTIVRPHVQISSVQIETSIARLKHLPVFVVELNVINIRELAASAARVLRNFLLLVLLPINYWKVWHQRLQLFNLLIIVQLG